MSVHTSLMGRTYSAACRVHTIFEQNWSQIWRTYSKKQRTYSTHVTYILLSSQLNWHTRAYVHTKKGVVHTWWDCVWRMYATMHLSLMSKQWLLNDICVDMRDPIKQIQCVQARMVKNIMFFFKDFKLKSGKTRCVSKSSSYNVKKQIDFQWFQLEFLKTRCFWMI